VIMAIGPLPIFQLNRQLGHSAICPPSRVLIDYRIDTLELSWRHAIPFRPTNLASTTTMAFDEAESRFLLSGTSRGSVFIIDFESAKTNESAQAYPIQHRIIPSRSKCNHGFLVSCCQWYPVDSSIFATSGRDKLLKLWDSNCMTAIESFSFEMPINQFHWTVGRNSTKSSLIAVAISSSNVSLIDPRIGTAVQQIRSQNEAITTCRWLKISDFILVTGSNSGRISFWDTRSGQNKLHQVQTQNALKKHQGNQIISLRDSECGLHLISMTRTGNIQIWDAATSKMIESADTPNAPTGQLDISTEGKSLYAFIPVENNVAMFAFNPLSFNSQRRFHAVNKKFRLLKGHFQPVVCCTYRKRYQQLISSANDRLMLIWSSKMDENRPEAGEFKIQQLYEDAYSDED